MGYIALRRLRWGDQRIEPGEPVPEGEPGRNYTMMERSGQIAGAPERKRKAERPAEKPKADAPAKAAAKPAAKPAEQPHSNPPAAGK